MKTRVLLLGLLSSLIQGSISVEIRTPREKISAPVDNEVEFICSSDIEKKFCLITKPDATTIAISGDLVYENGRIVPLVDDPKQCGIKITSLQKEDHGVWQCQVSVVDNGNYVTGTGNMEVTVSIPPESVELRLDNEPILSDVISIDISGGENTTNMRSVSCVATQARPAPEFRWFIGNDEIKGQVEDSQENPNEEGIADFVQTLKYFANSQHNGKDLKCVLEHNAYNDKELADKVNEVKKKLEILFKPKPKQRDVIVYGLKEGKEDTFSIKFEANPQPESGSWSLAGRKEPIVFGSESVDQEFKSGFIEPTELDGEYKVSLTIKKVAPTMAGKPNKLTVTNSKGTTEYTFVLKLGEKPPQASVGSAPVIGVIVVVVIVILLIGIAIVARSKGILCFSAKNGEQLHEEKEAANFDAVEKGEPLNPKTPEGGGASNPEGADKPADKKSEEEEKKSNGAHTPV